MMHSIYVTYIIFALPTYKYLILSGCNSTNVLYAATYHTTFFVIVDEPKYTRTTSVYCVTGYVCII